MGIKSVGLALIVRDCADTLGVCLQSVVGLFDQICVTDTGSSDNTIEVAKSFGAEISYFSWIDDFSAARNFSFDQLKTDYAFWLDGDDLAIGREHFAEMVEKCTALDLDAVALEYFYAFDAVGEKLLALLEPTILSGQADSQSVIAQLRARCTTTQYRERLIRNDPTWRWKYPIHEALPVAGKRLGKYEKIKVIHRRHVRKNPVSSDRNLRILQRVPVERRDERIYFYLGLEHAHHHHFDESIAAFEQYLPLATIVDEKYLALHWLGDLCRAKGELDRAIVWNLQAVALRPTWRDAYAGLVEIYAKKEDWLRVVYYGALTKQAEVPDTPFAYNPLHEEVGWVGNYVLGLSNLGQLGEALKESERALEVVPEDPAHRHNVDALSISLNLHHGKQSIAETVEFFLRHDDAETAALILARLSPDLLDNPDIRRWVAMTGALCGAAARGEIPKDELKQAPALCVSDEVVNDYRMVHLMGEVAKRPDIQRVLQIGGPLEVYQPYMNAGLEADRIEHVEKIPADHTYDAAILWSCLERVKYPENVVERARSAVRPGGYLLACVPNGPARKGLSPPESGHLRLRAYSVDTFRQVMGTVKMPDILPGWAAEAGDLWLTAPLPLSPGRPRAIAIVCPFSPEPWGPTSLETGIGGSEEAVIRLSRAFARRGHVVTVYGSGYVGEDLPLELGEPHGKVWYESISDYRPADILIGWRYPEIFFNQIRPFEAEWKALWLHDSLAKERVAAVAPFVDAIWCISDYHAGLYEGISKVYKGRNGIDPDMFHGDPPSRNPAKMIWSSTPFRGLDGLLTIWPQIKQQVPEAELHVFYGWESADRMGVTATPDGAAFKARVMQLIQQPGILWRGRVGQPELYREFLSAGCWSYYTNWKEEHCIGSYIAQASGAWPVVIPLGALPQSVVFGWKVDYGQFINAVVEAVQTDGGREQMMHWARRHLSWDDVASDWERLFLGGVIS